MQYGLTDSEFIHSLCRFLDKNEESFDNILKYHQLGSSHVIQYLSWLQRGSYIKIWWNNSGSAYLTLQNDSHTLIWVVILWYNEPRECLPLIEKYPHIICNTVSSLVNVGIRYAIIWVKKIILYQYH